MPFSQFALTVASKAIQNGIKGIQLHSADPGQGGASNRSTAGAKQPVWSAVDSTGSFSLAQPLQFMGCGSGAVIAWVSLWDSTSLGGANWYGNVQITGDTTADSAGNYTLSSLVINGSSA